MNFRSFCVDLLFFKGYTKSPSQSRRGQPRVLGDDFLRLLVASHLGRTTLLRWKKVRKWPLVARMSGDVESSYKKLKKNKNDKTPKKHPPKMGNNS